MGHRYTTDQVDWLRLEAPHWTRSELAVQFNEWFGVRLSHEAISRKCNDLGLPSLHSGPAYTGRFRPGRGPSPGSGARGPGPTSFGAPGRPGGSPRRPIGAERFEPRWGLLVKVAEPDPFPSRAGSPERWVRKARWVWERTHGPVPEGKVVVHLNGDRRDCALGNLAVVSRAVLLRVNGRLARLGGTRHPDLVRAEYARALVAEAIADRGGVLPPPPAEELRP